MKLLFKQRFFSWFDSYDIYDEAGSTVYVVRGQLSWGHCLKIFDPTGSELGTVKQRVFALPPKFDLYRGDAHIGCIQKEFKLFSHHYNIDCNGRRHPRWNNPSPASCPPRASRCNRCCSGG